MNSKSLAVLACLLICLPAAYAQGVCTPQTIAGNYAFQFTGSSTIVTGAADDGFHWKALYAPIAGVGVVTLTANGTGTGRYWLIAGAINSGLDPIPLQSTFTVNEDCTGTTISKYGTSTLKEKFVVLDYGREIRAVAMETAMPTGNWTTTMRRIYGSCGQNQVHGKYLYACKNMYALPVPEPNVFAGAFNMHILITPGGQWTGQMMYGKVGPGYSEFPVKGDMAMSEDCTFEGHLTTVGVPGLSVAKGVFFDDGRQGYLVPLLYRFPDGSTSPQVYGYCEITLISRQWW